MIKIELQCLKETLLQLLYNHFNQLQHKLLPQQCQYNQLSHPINGTEHLKLCLVITLFLTLLLQILNIKFKIMTIAMLERANLELKTENSENDKTIFYFINQNYFLILIIYICLY